MTTEKLRRKRGRPSKGYRVPLNLMIPPDVVLGLKALAKDWGMSASDLITRYMRALLNEKTNYSN